MIPDDPNIFPNDPEARLTALILGELSPEEAAAVRQAIEQDAELARLHERLKRTIELVREATAHPSEETNAPTVPLQLSPERREKLLEQFKVVKPAALAGPRKRRLRSYVPLSLAALLIGALMLAAVMMSNTPRSEERSEIRFPSAGRFEMRRTAQWKLPARGNLALPMSREAEGKDRLLSGLRFSEAATTRNDDYGVVSKPAQSAPPTTPAPKAKDLYLGAVDAEKSVADLDLNGPRGNGSAEISARGGIPAADGGLADGRSSARAAGAYFYDLGGASAEGSKTKGAEMAGEVKQELAPLPLKLPMPTLKGTPDAAPADVQANTANADQLALAKNTSRFTLETDGDALGKKLSGAKDQKTLSSSVDTPVNALAGNEPQNLPGGSLWNYEPFGDGGPRTRTGLSSGPRGDAIKKMVNDSVARRANEGAKPQPGKEAVGQQDLAVRVERFGTDAAADFSITPAPSLDLAYNFGNAGLAGGGGGEPLGATHTFKSALRPVPADSLAATDKGTPSDNWHEADAFVSANTWQVDDDKAFDLFAKTRGDQPAGARDQEWGLQTTPPAEPAPISGLAVRAGDIAGPATVEFSGITSGLRSRRALVNTPQEQMLAEGKDSRSGKEPALAQKPAASRPAAPTPVMSVNAVGFVDVEFKAGGAANEVKADVKKADAEEKVALLGDLPVQGRFFRSPDINRTAADKSSEARLAAGGVPLLAGAAVADPRGIPLAAPAAEQEWKSKLSLGRVVDDGMVTILNGTEVNGRVIANYATEPAQVESRVFSIQATNATTPTFGGFQFQAGLDRSVRGRKLAELNLPEQQKSTFGERLGQIVQKAAADSSPSDATPAPVAARPELARIELPKILAEGQSDIDALHEIMPEANRAKEGKAATGASAARTPARQLDRSGLSSPERKDGKENATEKEVARTGASEASKPETSERSPAYLEKKRELDELVQLRDRLSQKLDQEKVSIPKSSIVEIVDLAAAPTNKATLWGRVQGAFGGKAEATARITVRDNSNVASGKPVMTSVTPSYDPYFIQSESEAIQSRPVLDEVVQKLNLNDTWAGKSGAGKKLSSEETYQRLKKMIELRPNAATSLLDIRVKSDNPDEAARIANTVAEVYRDYRVEQRQQMAARGDEALKTQRDAQEKKIASAREELARLESKPAQPDVAPPKSATPASVPQPEVQTRENPFSTFSLNVSDVSFKLAHSSLEKGAMPDPATVRSEEFINAFDYRDPDPLSGVAVGFNWERTRYPFAHNRDLVRFALRTAARGREPGRALNLVLLLDNSGSMERADRVRIIRESLRVLAAQLKPQDKLSVVTFSRTARLWVDGVAGNEAGAVAEKVADLTPQGGTNLEEAMNLAYQTAARHFLNGGVNRVVLLTDGAANLGDVEPESLKKKVETQRKQGIALDCFGIGWEGYNDDLLEVLSRHGDGRYGFINSPDEAASEFAAQLAGALQVAAADVKVQVEFNPARVLVHRQIGYAKHQLTKEQFRDNTVDAAEIGAAETGNALYLVQVNPQGEGPIATVRVRYRVPATGQYREQEWPVPYTGTSSALEQASPAMRLAATASAFSEWLANNPYAGEVTPDRLLGYLSGVTDVYQLDPRPKRLEWMIRQAKSISGK